MFSWYKYLIVSLVFSHLGFWSGSLFLIAPFPDLCLLVLFFLSLPVHFVGTIIACLVAFCAELLYTKYQVNIIHFWDSLLIHVLDWKLSPLYFDRSFVDQNRMTDWHSMASQVHINFLNLGLNFKPWFENFKPGFENFKPGFKTQSAHLFFKPGF